MTEQKIIDAVNIDEYVNTRDTAVTAAPKKEEGSSTEQDTTVADLVILKNNQVLTTSLKVAETFGKEHFHVMRDIRDLIKQSGGVSKNGLSSMFFEATYKNQQNKQQPMYYINRDGFTLLAMGFTGEKALKFKMAYIEAFNNMEAKLKEQQKPLTTVEMFGLAYQALKEHEERLNQHSQQISQNTADIQRLFKAHNGVAFRHEMKDISQQKQLDRHEGQISSLNQDMTDIKSALTPEFSNVDKKQAAALSRRVYLLAGSKSEISYTWGRIQGTFVENLQIDIGIETARAQEFLNQYYYQAKMNGNPPSSVLRPADIKNLSFNQLVTMKSEWYYEVLDIIKFYETEKGKERNEEDI